MSLVRWVPRILRDDGMIAASEVAHYTHLNLTEYVNVADLTEWLQDHISAVNKDGLHMCIDDLLAQVRTMKEGKP